MGQAVAYESVAKREVLKRQIDDMERQAKRMDREYASGLVESASFSHDRINDKAGFLSRLKSKKRQLALVTPPSVAELKARGIKMDDLRERREQLAKFIVLPIGRFPRMRSHEEMEKCPAGADDLNKMHHRKIAHHNIDKAGNLISVDHSKSQYPGYVEYKNLCRILSAGEGSEAEMDNSIANLEMLRPARVNDNESMFASRTFASPASRLTAQEYEERVGIESLNPMQLALHELEKEGKITPPTMEEHFERMFGPGENKSGEDANSPAPSSLSEAAPSAIDGPIQINDTQWMLPDGSTLEGTKEAVMAQWEALKDAGE